MINFGLSSVDFPCQTGLGLPTEKAVFPVASSNMAMIDLIPKFVHPFFLRDGSRLMAISFDPDSIMSTALFTISNIKFPPSPTTTKFGF